MLDDVPDYGILAVAIIGLENVELERVKRH